jgi:hypothetical protein
MDKLKEATLISSWEYVKLLEPKFIGQTPTNENLLYWMVFEAEGKLYKTLNYLGRDQYDIPLETAKAMAQEGIKMSHRYFTDNEWLVVRGNCITFEDGVNIFWDEWAAGKDYLKVGWKRFQLEE